MTRRSFACRKYERSPLQSKLSLAKVVGMHASPSLLSIFHLHTHRSAKFASTGRRRTSFLGNSTTTQETGLTNREWELIMTSASKVQYLHTTPRSSFLTPPHLYFPPLSTSLVDYFHDHPRYQNGDVIFLEGIANSRLFR